MLSYQYRDPHHKDGLMTVTFLNGNPYTCTDGIPVPFMNLGAPTDWYDTILILLQHIETESRPYVFQDEPCYLGTVINVNTLTSM